MAPIVPLVLMGSGLSTSPAKKIDDLPTFYYHT